MLPTTRLAGAGASPAEIDQLQAEHDAQAPEARDSLLAWLAGIAESGIRDWLETLRANDHFGDAAAASAAAAASEPAPEQPTGNPAHDPHAVATLAAQLEGKPKPRAPRKRNT